MRVTKKNENTITMAIAHPICGSIRIAVTARDRKLITRVKLRPRRILILCTNQYLEKVYECNFSIANRNCRKNYNRFNAINIFSFTMILVNNRCR